MSDGSIPCAVSGGLVRILVTVVFATALTACGGGTQTEDDFGAITPPPQDRSAPDPMVRDDLPSPDGPYSADLRAADGVLIRYRSGTTIRAASRSLKAAGATLTDRFRLVDGLAFAALPAGSDVDQALAALRADSDVAYAEPNYVVTTFATPDDPSYSRQYALNNTGQTGGSSDADIDAAEAWDLQTGRQVVIAVIDTGVDYNHPDLRSNIWTNPGEIAGNRVDDDGNGYVDDVRGWDFANNDNNPMDDNRHGTHVAGIIAAEGNNSIGVAGVNWSARIMPLKFMSANGSGTTASAIRAIEYAVANGARISNNSWGGGGRSQALSDAIAAANGAGHLFVAAAGNAGANNDSNPTYPASYSAPNIISVAATDSSDRLAGFSNYGANSVHLGAPGVSILSTTPNNSYASLSGTSMATPVVAGVAGLVLSNNPSMSVSALKNALLQSVDGVGVLRNNTIAGGRINAFTAVSSAVSAPPPPAPAPANISVTPANASVAAGASVQLAASGGAAPYVWDVANPNVGTVSSSGVFVAARAGTTTVAATDANGSQGIVSVTVTQTTVTPGSGSVGVGQTMQFTASGGTAPYRWSSSNSAVAGVDNSGRVNGISAGFATITATDANGVQAAATVTVQQQATVTVSAATQLAGVGRQITFTASGGAAPYQWSSNNPTVLTVNSSGVGTAQGPGRATVTATDANGVSGSSQPVQILQVSVDVDRATVIVGGSASLTAAGGTAPYTWTVSNTNVASVTPGTGGSAVLNALNAGSVSVTATDSNGVAGESASIQVSGPSANIAVSPNSIDVPSGWWVRFNASGGTAPYTWSLSNPSAGSLSTTTGWFRATGPLGASTTVIVTDASGNAGQSGVVNVTAAPAGHR